jgi:futalosine hydrolase
MKILMVAATWMEVKLLMDELEFRGEKSHLLKQYWLADHEIDILITGIGTTFAKLVINLGIAGSLTHDLKIGEVVSVTSEEFADLGIEEKEEFLTLFETGFIESNEFPFEGGVLKATNNNNFSGIKKVRGITTNKSHGRGTSIEEIQQKFMAHVESMEGAAVLFVCNWFGVSCYQIRAISNYVEPRDSSKWNIPLALENLKKTILEILHKLPVAVN